MNIVHRRDYSAPYHFTSRVHFVDIRYHGDQLQHLQLQVSCSKLKHFNFYLYMGMINE